MPLSSEETGAVLGVEPGAQGKGMAQAVVTRQCQGWHRRAERASELNPQAGQKSRWHLGERGKRLLAEAVGSWEPEPAGLGKQRVHAAV